VKHTLQPHEPQEYDARGAYVQLAYAGLRCQLLSGGRSSHGYQPA